MTDDLQQYVNQKIESGQFGTAEEFAAEAIRVYRKIEIDYDQFRNEIQKQITNADAGGLEALDMDAIKQELIDEFNEDGTPK